jgi:hypothetical protein
MILPNWDWESLPGGEPAQEGRRVVVPHRAVVEWLRQAAAEGGLDPRGQLVWLSLDLKDLVTVSELGEAEGWRGRPCVAARSSHRKGLGLRWYHGYSLPGGAGVCVARSPDQTRQTSAANVRAALVRCVDSMANNSKAYGEHAKHLRALKMTPARWGEMLMEVVRKGDKDRERPSWRAAAAADKQYKKLESPSVWDALACFARATAALGEARNWNVYRLDHLYQTHLPFAPEAE